MIESVSNYFKPIRLEETVPLLSLVELENSIQLAATPDTLLKPSEFNMMLHNTAEPDPRAEATDEFELVIYPSLPPRLVYIGFRHLRGETRRYIVDANTSEILSAQFWGYKGKYRDPLPPPDTTEGSSRDVGGFLGPISPEPLPVFPMPNRDDDLPDSLAKPRHNPSPPKQRDKNRIDKKPTGRPQPTEKSDYSAANPQTSAYFFEPYILCEPWSDIDGDGYYRKTHVEWDVDTYDDSAYVMVIIYGWVDQGPEYELFQFGMYWVRGDEPDIWNTYLTVPFKGEWSFRLDLEDSLGVLLDQYPEIPGSDPTMINVRMETKLDDLDCYIGNAFAFEHYDNDGDGFAQLDSLQFRLTIEDYDTINPLAMRAQFHARNIVGREVYAGETDYFFQQPGTSMWWYTFVPAGRNGLWDFRIELTSTLEEIGTSCEYDEFPGLVDLPMERWIEDPPITVVFDPNPVVTLSGMPGMDIDTLVDHGDSTYPALIQAFQQRHLQGLELDGQGLCDLVGPYVRISDWLPHDTPQAITVGDTIFPYYRDEPQFEEVMCYYHIDNCQRYVQALGFMNAYNAQIMVDAHGMANTANGMFTGYSGTRTGIIRFGDGQGVDFAEDADVILHEYGHAIQFSQTDDTYIDSSGGDLGYGNESLFMAEGFAFYWAASNTDFMNDIYSFPSEWYGEWAVRGNFPGDDTCLYNIANDHYYPEDMVVDTVNEPDYEHLNGLVWTGALWHLFEYMGKIKADSVVLLSHELMDLYNRENPVFSTGANMIIKADSLGYGGENSNGIFSIFLDIGFCFCGDPFGDLNCDGGVNPVDVVSIVNYVYKNLDGRCFPPNWFCLYDLGDVDCSEAVGPIDVVYYVNRAYKNIDNFCYPCSQ